MKCEVQVCTVKANGYLGCEAEATHIARFGHLYCETHASPADILLTASEAQERLQMRAQVAGEPAPSTRATEAPEVRCQRCGADLGHAGVHCEPCVQEMTD